MSFSENLSITKPLSQEKEEEKKSTQTDPQNASPSKDLHFSLFHHNVRIKQGVLGAAVLAMFDQRCTYFSENHIAFDGSKKTDKDSNM